MLLDIRSRGCSRLLRPSLSGDPPFFVVVLDVANFTKAFDHLASTELRLLASHARCAINMLARAATAFLAFLDDVLGGFRNLGANDRLSLILLRVGARLTIIALSQSLLSAFI